MKNKILKILKENNNFISGEYLSELFGVTRAAIWKSIKQLENEGYVIESRTKIGYKLISLPDRLYSSEIKELIPKSNTIGNNIIYFEELDSTNNYAKNLPISEINEGNVVVTEYQNKGRGRLNRVWVSPKYKDIKFSLILKPNISFQNIGHLTILFALAVCEAIEKYMGMTFEIKWPNDILFGGKKICGILTEISGEIDNIQFVVVGTGINVNTTQDDFNEELKDKITSLKIIAGKNINRVALFAQVLNSIEKYYMNYNFDNFNEILMEYKNKLTIMNQDIDINLGNDTLVGYVLDIMPNGSLKVRLKSGEIREFISGEVSIRSKSY